MRPPSLDPPQLAWIFRFWGRSALPVPPVDVTTTAESRRLTVFHQSQTQFLASVMTHTATLASIWAIGALIAGSLAWGAYKPWLDAYRDGCTATVRGEDGRRVVIATGNTALASNLYAMAFNAASSAGNKDRMQGLDLYDVEVDRRCDEHAPQTTVEHEGTVRRLAAAIDAHAAVANEMRMMRTCLDVARIDAELIIHADVAADSSALLAHALAEPACDETVSNSSLLLGSFDCVGALPDCMMDCAELSDDQGKDASGLSGFATGAACTAEWWFHSWLVNLAACAVVYLLANGGRVLFVWVRLCRT